MVKYVVAFILFPQYSCITLNTDRVLIIQLVYNWRALSQTMRLIDTITCKVNAK